MRDCLTWLEVENADPASPYHAQVDIGAFGLSGHSMGGGASLLAAADDARVRALAPLAPAETNPSAIAAMANVSVPVRLVNGSEDGIVPVEAHGALMYANGSPPRQIQIILGGFHCGFTDAGFLFCDSGSITRAEQLAITRRLLTGFFNLHLKDDQPLWSAVWGPEALADVAVEIESDAGVTLTPEEPVIQAPVGEVVTTVEVTNTGPTAASFTVLLEDADWTATATPASTAMLPPDATQIIEIAVTVPPDGAAEDVLHVTARRDDDHATRGFVTLTVRRGLVADLDGDGVVGFADLLMLLAAWGDCGPDECPADLDGSGDVGFSDLLVLLAAWG
jgi:hypothetical protein